MREPAFWRRPPGWQARLLAPLGAIYGAVTTRRMARPGARLGRPVVSVGNFVVGGAGKTPVTALLANLLRQAGQRPCVVSRGYGGSEAGPLVVDPAQHDAARVGDEPRMLARDFSVIVARDRAAGARLAIAQGADAIVLDDALQNPALNKDVSLAVVDAQYGVGNGYCVPAGPLRAPLMAQLAGLDAVVLLGGAANPNLAAALQGRPTFGGRLTPDEAAGAALTGQRVFAFSGIARPEKFHASLREVGARVEAAEAFPDHYPISEIELADMAAVARKLGLTPVTTEKDAARIGDAAIARHFGESLRVLPVRVVMADEAAFRDFLFARLGRQSSAKPETPR